MDDLAPLLSSARRVGSDYCWPADEALEVIDRLASLSLAILGVELWRFGADGPPEVLGWSDYRLDTDGPWTQVVADGARLAADAVLGHSGTLGLWVNITWMDSPNGGPEAVGFVP
jgi:hypothetical protein